MQAPLGQPGIELHGVGVMRADKWILRDIHWSVPGGACVAILGPNGSGKSTLARILSGYIWPTAGDVHVAGRHFGDTDLNDLRHSIRLIQPAGPYDVDPELTAQQAVLTGLFGTIGLFDAVTDQQRDHAFDLLARVGLSRVAGHAYYTLSSGERIRALIARSLIVRPKLLLMDEPTAGLDLLAREQVLATVQSLLARPGHDTTVVMITHHIEELAPATSRVLLLSEGQAVAQGAPAEVLRDDVLSRAYGCPLHVQAQQGRYYVQVDPQAWTGLLNGS